jgi:hypothetical protein
VFVVVNLFIAVVINNLEAAKLEEQAEADRNSRHHALLATIEDVRQRLGELERQLRDGAPAAPAHSGQRLLTAPAAPPRDGGA